MWTELYVDNTENVRVLPFFYFSSYAQKKLCCSSWSCWCGIKSKNVHSGTKNVSHGTKKALYGTKNVTNGTKNVCEWKLCSKRDFLSHFTSICGLFAT